jgi:dynein heavy chain, axonemal
LWKQVNLNGNILLAAGCIAYSGPFTSNFRQSLVRSLALQPAACPELTVKMEQVSQWLAACHKHTIPVDPTFSLEAVLGQPSEIRKWNIQVKADGRFSFRLQVAHPVYFQGLPADALSVENGLIVTLGRRWPLMIDPQTQVRVISMREGRLN